MKFPKQFIGILITASLLLSQNLTLPRASLNSVLKQTIGISSVEINYSRPNVNNREIWGQLVPYGLSAAFNGNTIPWRAGANENTTIEFSHDVHIEGKALKAGIYGLHMIPGKEKFEIIFSSDYKAWGSFNYDPSNNVLKVSVKPQKADAVQSLRYESDHLTRSSAEFSLRWEKLKIPFKVEFNTNKIVVENLAQELKGAAGFNSQNFANAAQFCIDNNISLDQAELWLNRSMAQGRNLRGLVALSQLQDIKGNKKEAEKLIAEALEIGSENDLNTLGYQMMAAQKIKLAFRIFKMNTEKNPNSWNVFDSLAEYYNTTGDRPNAKKYYSQALAKLPKTDTTNKNRIETILKSL